jgi:hypothetical protein
MDKIFAQYYEDLLRVQYLVSESLVQNQHLSCGTIREEFIRDILTKRRNSLNISKGFICRNDKKSSECDHIFNDKNSPINNFGGQLFIDPKYVKLVLEIKSNATGNDFKQTNLKFKEIKKIDSNMRIPCGMFCYNSNLKKGTVLKRFGWKYDEDLDAWIDESKFKLEYPFIDFILCLSTSEEYEIERIQNQYFFLKDYSSKRYILNVELPMIKHLFAITDNV